MGIKKTKKRGALVRKASIYIAVIGVLGAAWALRRLNPFNRNKIILKTEMAVERFTHKIFSFFVPHHTNGFKPRIFQTRATMHIVLIVVVVKVSLLSTLFIVYPNLARLTTDVKNAMYELVNSYRGEQKIADMKPSSYLESTASLKAKDMIVNNYFSHFGPDGKKPWQWIDAGVYSYDVMGENLAMDFITAGAVLRAFQQSPAHDRNLLNVKYTEIGIAVENGFVDGHSTNVMVVMFARPKAPAPALQPAPVPVVGEKIEPKPATGTERAQTTPLVQGSATEVSDDATQPVGTISTGEKAEVVSEAENVAADSTVSSEETSFADAVLGDTVPSRVNDAEAADVVTVDLIPDSITSLSSVYSDNLSGGVIFAPGSGLQRFIAWSDRFFMGFAIALVMLLVTNIIVKIRVQHASVIVNATLLIAVVSAAFYVNVHRAEAIGEKVRILAAFFS